MKSSTASSGASSVMASNGQVRVKHAHFVEDVKHELGHVTMPVSLKLPPLPKERLQEISLNHRGFDSRSPVPSVVPGSLVVAKVDQPRGDEEWAVAVAATSLPCGRPGAEEVREDRVEAAVDAACGGGAGGDSLDAILERITAGLGKLSASAEAFATRQKEDVDLLDQLVWQVSAKSVAQSIPDSSSPTASQQLSPFIASYFCAGASPSKAVNVSGCSSPGSKPSRLRTSAADGTNLHTSPRLSRASSLGPRTSRRRAGASVASVRPTVWTPERMDGPSLGVGERVQGGGEVRSELRPVWRALNATDIVALKAQREKAVGSIIASRASAASLHGSARFALGSWTVGQHLAKPMPTVRARFVFDPDDPYRLLFQLACCFFIIYDVIMVPLQAFELSKNTGALDIIEWTSTLLWTLDIPVSVRTGYYVGYKLETNGRLIALKYAKTWMVFDVTVVSLDWFSRCAGAVAGPGTIMRLTRALRGLRLIRLAKLPSLWTRFSDQSQWYFRIDWHEVRLSFSLFKITGMLIIIVHCIASGWYSIGRDGSFGWTKFYVLGFGEEDAPPSHKDVFFWYCVSSRWALAQILGEIDLIERRNSGEMVYILAVSLLCAVLFMRFFSSIITAGMMQFFSMREQKNSKTALVREYIARHNISQGLVNRMRQHLTDYQIVNSDQEKEEKVLSLLPAQLQHDLLFEVRKPLLHQFLFFIDLDTEFPRVSHQLCHVSIEAVSAHKWEVIFQKGDACHRMLVVCRGDLRYSEKKVDPCSLDICLDQLPIGQALRTGCSVSEAALWMKWENMGQLIAGACGMLLEVDAMSFSHVLKEHHFAWSRAALYARDFVLELQSAPKVNDLLTIMLKKPGEHRIAGHEVTRDFGFDFAVVKSVRESFSRLPGKSSLPPSVSKERAKRPNLAMTIPSEIEGRRRGIVDCMSTQPCGLPWQPHQLERSATP